MMLAGEQKGQLHKALLSAYSNLGALKILVGTWLEENLEAIAGGDNLSEVIYALIDWAVERGRLEELVAKAQEQNPGNPKLRKFAEAFLHSKAVAGNGTGEK